MKTNVHVDAWVRVRFFSPGLGVWVSVCYGGVWGGLLVELQKGILHLPTGQGVVTNNMNYPALPDSLTPASVQRGLWQRVSEVAACACLCLCLCACVCVSSSKEVFDGKMIEGMERGRRHPVLAADILRGVRDEVGWGPASDLFFSHPPRPPTHL